MSSPRPLEPAPLLDVLVLPGHCMAYRNCIGMLDRQRLYICEQLCKRRHPLRRLEQVDPRAVAVRKLDLSALHHFGPGSRVEGEAVVVGGGYDPTESAEDSAIVQAQLAVYQRNGARATLNPRLAGSWP